MVKNFDRSLLLAALVAATLLGALPVSAQQNHYRWLNERGEPVYSDRPPPLGVDYEVVSSSSGLKRVVPAEVGAVPAETEPTVGNEFDPVNPGLAERSKKNPEMCNRAHTNLKSLTSSEKVQMRNAQGEVRMLSPEEIQVEVQTAKAQIEVYCEE